MINCKMLSSLLCVLLMAALFEPLLAEALQKKECVSRCGNVKIEKPFGIGPDCSRNEYFEVTCNASSPSNPKLFLTKYNLELLKIQRKHIGGEITVNMPVARACGDNKRLMKGAKDEVICSNRLNFSGSPFHFFNENVFVSVGCDGFASLYDETGGLIGGCTSTCNPLNSGAEILKGCNGYLCCQRQIVMNDLQTLTIHTRARRMGVSRSAFIISRNFLNSDATAFNISAIAHSAVTPLVLAWFYDEDFNREIRARAIRFVSLPIGIAIGTLLLSCGCCGSWWFCKTKKARMEAKLRAKYFKGRLKQNSSNGEQIYMTKLFTMKELKTATGNFNGDRILGQGGQGTVYKGMLANGQVIAVKRSKSFEETQWKQFINEVILLSQMNHKNIVKLLGCCLETKLPLIIYEFIPNGTLSQHIHSSTGEFVLTWDMRVRIASEAADAIAYLHSSSTTPIYHRDIKSSNLLLDAKFQVKVSDFGISKAIPMDQTHLTTCVQGTFGYLDPEYFRSSQFSEKSDVYSFGVILVELLTGQHPVRMTTSEEERSLAVYFITTMNESRLDEILDPLALENSTKEEVTLVANLARRCLKSRGAERPTMTEVAMELEGLRTKLSSTTTVQEISLEIEDVISIPRTVMRDFVNLAHQNSDDELPLFGSTL